MERSQLIHALKTVEPAIATKDFMPVLMHVQFGENTVVAFDDVVAIKARCACGLVGTFPGRVLLDFLGACGAQAVDVVENSSTDLLLKVGRSKLTLPKSTELLPTFGTADEPKLKAAQSIPATEALLLALAQAFVSVGTDSLQLWSYGVTLSLGKKQINCYASNAFSVAKTSSPADKATGKALLPPRFVETLLKQSRKDAAKFLYLWEAGDWVAASFESGTVLYCRTVPEADPDRFEELLVAVGGAELVPLPKALEGSLRRCAVFQTATSIADRLATFRVSKDKLYVEVQTDRGSMRDFHKLEGHPELALKAPPELILAALPYATQIAFVAEKAVCLAGDGFEYMVAGAL